MKESLRLLLIIIIVAVSVLTVAPANISVADDGEVIDLRTEKSKTYENPDGTRTLTLSMSAMHYKDDVGEWQNIDTGYYEDDTGDYTARFSRLPYVIRMGDDSTRRIYPDRNDMSYWIEIGKPFPSMGIPEKVGDYWVWDYPNAAIGIKIENESVKLGFRLKNESAPSTITFPFSSQGITRDGRYLYHDGEIVGELQKPYAIDAEGVEREVEVTFGLGEITLSLDTTGLAYPIDIDPTYQVGHSYDDNYCRFNDSYFDRTNNNQLAGRWASTYGYGGSMRFTSIALDQGANIIEAHLTFTAYLDGADTVNTRIRAQQADNPGQITNFADYQARWNGGTAQVDWDALEHWSGGTEYDSPDISSVIQTIVDRPGWSSGNAMVIFWDDHDERSSAVNACYRIAYSYDSSTSKAAKLSITYGELPAAATNTAGSVTHNTANVSGNITSVGSEAYCDIRGFVYDESSYADPGNVAPSASDYSENWTESGSWEVGEFTANITGLDPETTYYYRAVVHNAIGWDYGDVEETFTTGVAPPDVPTGFTLTDYGSITVGANWTKGLYSTYTMIRASREEYPETVTDGELVYYGTSESANTSGYALDTTKYYFTAWGFGTDNVTYSNEVAQAYIGGSFMEEIADALETLASVFNDLVEQATTMSGGVSLAETLFVEALLFASVIVFAFFAIISKERIMNLLPAIGLLIYAFHFWQYSQPVSFLYGAVAILFGARMKWGKYDG